MRIVSAWFLISLSMAQWVGGHLCFEVSYFIEIQRRMNAAEEALAATVTKETGIKSAVRVLQEDEVVPRGNFYGDFVFSQASEEETVFYVVEDQTELVTYDAVSNPHQKNTTSDTDQTSLLLKGLFKDFMRPEPQLPLAPSGSPAAPEFLFSGPYSSHFPPLLFHPPANA